MTGTLTLDVRSRPNPSRSPSPKKTRDGRRWFGLLTWIWPLTQSITSHRQRWHKIEHHHKAARRRRAHSRVSARADKRALDGAIHACQVPQAWSRETWERGAEQRVGAGRCGARSGRAAPHSPPPAIGPRACTGERLGRSARLDTTRRRSSRGRWQDAGPRLTAAPAPAGRACEERPPFGACWSERAIGNAR